MDCARAVGRSSAGDAVLFTVELVPFGTAIFFGGFVKTLDGAEALGKITGLGREEVMDRWESVKANRKLLNECELPHDFDQTTRPDNPLSPRARFLCSKCKGHVSGVEKLWYERGLEHGRNEKG